MSLQKIRGPLAPTLWQKLSYFKWLPGYSWQWLNRRTRKGPVHLIIAMADHFEPAIVPGDGRARVPLAEQESRLERWVREYPIIVDRWRDHDERPFVHTYFYPAEQYEADLVACLAEHCHAGYGEIEIHLHHGVGAPDTAANTHRQLAEFRDRLAFDHGCLSYTAHSPTPQYAFVHGSFALANSNGGRGCGVDSEIQVLAETGCYADMTLPTAVFHRSQTAKINSIYECQEPLDRKGSHTRGRNLRRAEPPRVFPLMLQGPLLLCQSAKGWMVENGALTAPNPPTLQRLHNWKRAGIAVQGKPEWLFIKLHCHGMDPTQENVVLGPAMKHFLQQLVEGAEARQEILHFVTAREMVNMILAACDGKDGEPGQYRDYRLKAMRHKNQQALENLSGGVSRG